MIRPKQEPLGERVDALLASRPEALADPFPLYAEIRAYGRVFSHGPMVFLTHYDDVKAVISDGVRFSNHAWMGGSRARSIRDALSSEHQAMFDEVAAYESNSISRSDDPQHARLRAISHRAFTPRRIEALRPSIERYTNDALDALGTRGVVDLMSFAYGVPLAVISEILGIPHGDREMVHAWSRRIARNRGSSDLAHLVDAHAAHQEIRRYVQGIVDQHRHSPESISELVASLLDAEQGDRLSADELTAMLVVLIVAGHETTSNLVSVGLLELLRRPAQWSQLLDAPGRWPEAIEELLRFVTPAQWIPRYALVDVAVGDEIIPRGHTVIPLLSAANRDSRVFPDPDRLDIGRTESRRHLALGHGQHFCLGASLARLEALIAFEALATRFPEMTLTSEPLEWTGNAVLRRMARLPVTLNDSQPGRGQTG